MADILSQRTHYDHQLSTKVPEVPYDGSSLIAEDVQTMGSLGAPGIGFGWAPAISFNGDDPDAIQNAYVTPPSATKREEVGERERDFIREAVLSVYG